MPSFTNLQDLMNYVKKESEYSLLSVAERIKTVLKDYIQLHWYDRMQPNYYDRTMEFIDSLTISPIRKTGNITEIEVYFDTNKIHAKEATNPEYWNQHMGLNGEDVHESIPYFIEYGNNSSVYSYEGIHMIENTVKYCKSNQIPVKEMMNELRRQGFTLK